MARLLTRGFESGLLGAEVDGANGSALITSSPTPRTGTYALFVGDNSAEFATWTIPATDVIYAGWAFRAVGAGDNNQRIMYVSTANSSLAVEPKSNWSFNIVRGSTDIAQSDAGIWMANTWHYLEAWVFLDNASGRVVLKVDGNTVIDFTGDTLSSSDPDMTTFRLYGIHNTDTWADDVVVNDDAGSVNNSWPGIISLEPLFPTSAGDNTDLTRGGSDSGSNWGQVDEIPPDAVSWVYDTVIDNYDLYNIADLALPAGAAIQNVIVQGRAQLDSGAGNMALMIKAGATESDGSTEILAAGWNDFWEVWDVNPDDSAAWEDADIDALQIGVKVK